MKLGNRPPATEQMPNVGSENMQQFAAAVLNKGMNTQSDPSDIDNGALQVARNVYIRFDKTSRRFGTSLITPLKPDSNPVLKLVFLKKNNGTAYTVRMTPTTLHKYTDVAWIPIVGDLDGTVNDRFRVAVINNEMVFTNNGANKIQKIDFGAMTFGDLGNSELYRYVTGFYNRVVAAAIRGVDEVYIGWSADGVLDQFDPLVDNTAGGGPLTDSASDLSDFIKGIFGFTNVMVVVREKSVVLANKQPVPTAPFYFYTAVPDTGCDCPHSITPVRGGGLAWVDRRTNSVYTYFPGQQPIPIAQNVEKDIFANIADTDLVFGGFDPVALEYCIGIPQVGTKMIKEWRINLRNQAWAYNERYDLTTIDEGEFFFGGGLTIDQLPGLIDNLTGTIDQLSGASTAVGIYRSYGHGDGTIAKEDPTQTKDAPHADYPTGVEYTTEIVSKAFEQPDVNTLYSQIKIEYKALVGGTFQLQYSKNGGATTDSWRVAKSITMTDLGAPRLLNYIKCIRARKLAWRLIATEGMFDILKYEINVYPGGRAFK